MMKTEDGKCVYEKMTRGSMVYVPPFWAHRSINTGKKDPLVSFCVYPGDAGHNYGDIEKTGLPETSISTQRQSRNRIRNRKKCQEKYWLHHAR